jgi:hypothetical protein
MDGPDSEQEPVMKRLLEKIEAALTAAAFAEEGEVETARRIMAEPETRATVQSLPRPTRPQSVSAKPPARNVARRR